MTVQGETRKRDKLADIFSSKILQQKTESLPFTKKEPLHRIDQISAVDDMVVIEHTTSEK